jgi:ATP-dependent helicase/nuclease subunit B
VSATIIPAGESLVDEVAGLIEGSGRPYAECTVVFPGKRPAHFLRQRLAREVGAGFIPPAILSMDGFVDELFEKHEERVGGSRPRLEPIDAVAILYDIQIGAPRPLGGPSFMSLDAFFPLGLKIHRDLEELHIEGVAGPRVAEVQPLVEGEVPPKSRERLRSLSHFYEEFYRRLDEQGFSTRSSRYRRVAEEIAPEDLHGKSLVILAGFYALTSAEGKLFRKMAAWPSVKLVFQDGDGLRKRLEGIAAPGDFPAVSTPPRPDTRFYRSADAHGQVFALNAALGEPDGATLIVLPSPDTLFPLVRHCLSRLDEESYNISLGYPLLRTPLYGFLGQLMELVESMDGEQLYLPRYVSFVLHPYTKNIRFGGSAEATRVLFHTLEERMAAARTRRFSTAEQIEEDEALFDEAARRISGREDKTLARALQGHLVDIHRRTIGRFRAFASVRDFADRVLALISWVSEESTARDHPFFSPFSEAFARSLETISRSLMAEKSFNGASSYFILLRRYLETCYLPFEGTPLHGLQILGALETRNLRFQRVFVLDANEGTLPESRAEGTLLPFPVRAALGLSTYRDQEEIAAYHFGLLSAGARELHLLFVEAGEKQKSRFAERLLWERQKAEGTLDERRHVRSIQYRVTLSNAPPPPVEKGSALADWLRLRPYSATSLDAYLRCPLQFYYKYALNLGQREQATGDIEAADIGAFVHEVLQRYFSSRKGRPLSAKDAEPSAMASLVDAMFAERFGSAETGANRLLCNQVRRHLSDFVGQYIKPLASSHRLSFQELERSVALSAEGFALRGRLDAVMQRDGKPFLIDYKTSAHRSSYTLRLKKLVIEDRTTWSAAVQTVQLPFYVLLHSLETGTDPAEIQAMFLLLGRTQMDAGIEMPLFDNDRPAAEAWPLLRQVIFGLLNEIASPDVPFAPTRDLKSTCPRCDFVGICGTGWLARG